MSVTRQRQPTQIKGAASRLRAAIQRLNDKALQHRAIEAERQIRSGEVAVHSAEESRKWMKDFVEEVSASRRRITQK